MKVTPRTTQEVLPRGPAIPFQETSASPAKMGAQVGQAIRGLGTEIERAGNVAADIQTRTTQTRALDTDANGFSPEMRAKYQQYYSLQGKDAIDRLPEFIQEMQDLRKKWSETMPTQEGRHMFDQLSRRRVEMELDGMARHADQQKKVWDGETFESSLKNQRNLAADKFNDERAFGTALGSGIAEIDRYAASSGKSSEWARARTQSFLSDTSVDRLSRWMLTDPLGADAWYKKNSNMVDAAQRPVIEHHLKSATLPVEAKTIAERIIAGQTANPAKEGEVLLPVAATQESMAKDKPAPLTPRDTRAELANWITTADQVAERLHPGDPVFRDLVVTQVKGYVNTIVAAQDGIARQAHGALMTAAMGAQGGAKPLQLDTLLSTPEARRAWALTDPQSQRGILALLEHNAKAARGEFAHSNPKLVQQLFNQIHLAEGDPKQIKSAAQLAPYFAKGLNPTDYDRLRKEIDSNQTPEGNVFLRDVNRVRQAAHTMITKSPIGSIQPDVAEEAAYRFNFDLQTKIEQYRTTGKDPRLLLTPGTPDYALTPERVASFMPNARQVVKDKADKEREAAAAAPKGKGKEPAKAPAALPRAVNPTTGETLELRDGKWQKPQ